MCCIILSIVQLGPNTIDAVPNPIFVILSLYSKSFGIIEDFYLKSGRDSPRRQDLIKSTP